MNKKKTNEALEKGREKEKKKEEKKKKIKEWY